MRQPGSPQAPCHPLSQHVLRSRDRIRRLLLRTALLDRLTGRLCDAVTGLDGGSRMPALHSAASGCYPRNGFAEAVRHALAAEDFEGPAGLRSVSRESLDEVHVGTASGRSPRGNARHRHAGGGTSTLDRATRDAAAGVAGVPGHFVRSVWRVTLGDVREVVAQGVHHNRAAVGVGEVGEGQGVGDGRE